MPSSNVYRDKSTFMGHPIRKCALIVAVCTLILHAVRTVLQMSFPYTEKKYNSTVQIKHDVCDFYTLLPEYGLHQIGFNVIMGILLLCFFIGIAVQKSVFVFWGQIFYIFIGTAYLIITFISFLALILVPFGKFQAVQKFLAEYGLRAIAVVSLGGEEKTHALDVFHEVAYFYVVLFFIFCLLGSVVYNFCFFIAQKYYQHLKQVAKGSTYQHAASR